MIQNILVILFIGGALIHIAYSTRKIWKRKTSAPTCGGCSQCEMKKTIVKHG